MPPKVTVYSDYICPFCLIGKSRVDRLEEQFGVEVEWKGFEIHPETPPEGRDRKSFGYSEDQMAAMSSHIEEMCAEEGLEVAPRTRSSNSKLAMQIGEFAKEKGRFKEYHDAVFRTYWQEGKDIGQRELLLAVAAEAGLDVGELEAYLEGDGADEKLAEHLREVMQYGIDGVPTFIIGNKMVVGAQPYEVLEKVLKGELSGAEKPSGHVQDGGQPDDPAGGEG